MDSMAFTLTPDSLMQVLDQVTRSFARWCRQSVLQSSTVFYSVLQCSSVCRSVLQCSTASYKSGATLVSTNHKLKAFSIFKNIFAFVLAVIFVTLNDQVSHQNGLI